MRDYSKLSPFFWVRGSGRRLRGDAIAQIVAAYLSTCPAANMVGIFYVSIATIADDTGHSAEDVRSAIVRIEAARYAFYDFDAGIAWIPNHARFEIGAEMTPGDKRRKKVLAELSQVEGHRFEGEFRALYAAAYGLRPPTTPPPAPRSEALPTSIPNQEGASADREQVRAGQDRTDQGQDRGRDIAPSEVGPSRVLAPDEPLTDSRESYVASVAMNTGEKLEAPQIWKSFVDDRIEKTVLYGSEAAIDAGFRKWVDREARYAKERRVKGRGSGGGPRGDRQPGSTDWLDRKRQRTGTEDA